MGLENIYDKDGNVIGQAIVCRRPDHGRCSFCRKPLERLSKLCDFPLGENKTCDAQMCNECATPVGPDVDYCPIHKDKK